MWPWHHLQPRVTPAPGSWSFLINKQWDNINQELLTSSLLLGQGRSKLPTAVAIYHTTSHSRQPLCFCIQQQQYNNNSAHLYFTYVELMLLWCFILTRWEDDQMFYNWKFARFILGSFFVSLQGFSPATVSVRRHLTSTPHYMPHLICQYNHNHRVKVIVHCSLLLMLDAACLRCV